METHPLLSLLGIWNISPFAMCPLPIHHTPSVPVLCLCPVLLGYLLCGHGDWWFGFSGAESAEISPSSCWSFLLEHGVLLMNPALLLSLTYS